MISRPSERYPDPAWAGWGDPAEVPVLPEPLLALLRDGLGVRGPAAPPPDMASLSLKPSRLNELAPDLATIAGRDNVSARREDRIRHALGKSTPDLFRCRADALDGAPDLIVSPATHDEVQELLRLCSERRVAVVPFGGGTSVVGGVEPEAAGYAGLVALDLRRMNALLGLDEEARIAQLEPGLRGPEAEALLQERGYTIGHFPQSYEYATVGGFAATRSSGQASAGYGRFDDLVVGMRVATPAGTLTLGRAPKSAAGPDLRQLVLGSEGAFGIITALSVQVRPVAPVRVYEGWRLGSFLDGAAAARRIAQDGPLPTVLRVSDEVETALNLARPAELGAGGAGSLAIMGYEGTAADVEHRRAAVREVLEHHGAVPEPGAGESWVEGRYRGPYMRDALLDAGALVETLETACFWSSLQAVYGAVMTALREALTAAGTPPAILCHISHVYRSGASLYFTVACARGDDPLAHWRAAKAAASEAILATGGSITHHHGIGRDHIPWYEREVGALAIEMLRAVKRTVDPAGILNPGILLPLTATPTANPPS